MNWNRAPAMRGQGVGGDSKEHGKRGEHMRVPRERAILQEVSSFQKEDCECDRGQWLPEGGDFEINQCGD
jgi:hypothetical protein